MNLPKRPASAGAGGTSLAGGGPGRYAAAMDKVRAAELLRQYGFSCKNKALELESAVAQFGFGDDSETARMARHWNFTADEAFRAAEFVESPGCR